MSAIIFLENKTDIYESSYTNMRMPTGQLRFVQHGVVTCGSGV